MDKDNKALIGNFLDALYALKDAYPGSDSRSFGILKREVVTLVEEYIFDNPVAEETE